MSDLTEFLLARLAEDEEAARRGVAEIEADPYAWTDFPSGDWSPARVLAECEAKRRTLTRYARAVALAGRHASTAVAAGALLSVQRDSAEVYADHPDYRDEWRA